MLTPSDAAGKAATRFRRWHKDWLSGKAAAWPWRIPLSPPTEKQCLENVSATHAWAENWQRYAGPGTVEWRVCQWNALGTHRLPECLILPDETSVALLAGRGEDWARAKLRAVELIDIWPSLAGTEVLGSQFEALATYDDAEVAKLIVSVTWLVNHPDSGLYLRQLPIEGVDSKWLETRGTLVSSFVSALSGREGRTLHDLCCLRHAPARTRLRILDQDLRVALGGLADIEAPVGDLAKLSLAPRAVLVVENLASGLALPDLPGVVAFLAMGNAAPQILAQLPWLIKVPVWYWGDLDTYGLAILARTRAALPQTEVRSLLMDEATLLENGPLWVQESMQHRELKHLTLTFDEQTLFENLRTDRWGKQVRLEQERLHWPLVVERLKTALT